MNKIDHIEESYCAISLLNCLGKVVEKTVVELLFEWCETEKVLHNGKIEARSSDVL